MRFIRALALALMLQTSALSQPLQLSPDIRQQQRHIAPAPKLHSQVIVPRRVITPPRGAPPELLHQTPQPPSAVVIRHPGGDFPGLVGVPKVSSLPAMRQRPIARHVRTHNVDLDIPAIVVVGSPYVIDVPGLGWVYVPEDEYPALFAMLTSDDPAQVEAAYERLQELASVH